MNKQSNQHPKNQSFHFLGYLAILSAFIFLSATSYAKTYYISSSTGNDSYSSAQAENQATPWRSITKLNSFMGSLAAGDYILFKKGDVFYGSIVITKSGSSGNPITFGAYGSGNKPIISGFSPLSSWTTVGNGIYQAITSGISNNLNMVAFNNQPQHIGRYPNADAANGGYLNYETFIANTSITDNQLTGTPNWTGAELVIRKTRWVIDRCLITNQSGSKITYSPVNTVVGTNGFGYFIQKDLKTLDQLGEWYYNTATKYFQMYFGSNDPSSYNVKVSTIDILFNTSRSSYITVSDLSFEGANIYAVNIGAVDIRTSNVSVLNCDINLSGQNAVYQTNGDYTRIENCNISNSFNNAIEFENEGGIGRFGIIRNNKIKNTGCKVGMASIGNSYQGIISYNAGAVIEYNTLDSTGYSGISFYYNDVKIRNNLVSNYAFVKDDGAGIYTWAGANTAPNTGREINNNIILNGIGAGLGKSNPDEKGASGIYVDEKTTGVDISNNTIANAAVAGIYVHNSHELNITNNTLFNNAYQVLFVHDAFNTNDPIRNVTFKNNIMVAKTSTQPCFTFSSIKDDITFSGATDSNYYARPVDDDLVLAGGSTTGNPTYNLNTWKAKFLKDANSKSSPKKVLPYIINSLTTANLVTNGDFTSNIAGGLSFYSQNLNNVTTWDGTSKITGAGSLKISFPTPTANIYTMCIKSIGAVSSRKNYILRFTTLGTTNNGLLRAFVRSDVSPWNNLVEKQSRSFGQSKTIHEFLFSAPTSSSSASVAIEIMQNSGTTYIDDIAFFEANTSLVNIDQQLRFEYNPTTLAKTIYLDAKYIGIDNTVYNGTITLQPYTSKVLINSGPITGAPLPSPPPPPPAQILKVTATVPTISCFGGNTTVTVSGAGGNTPYTGTGSYIVNAGKGSLKLSFPTVIASAYSLLYSSIGAVSSSKNYILRFSTLGTTGNGNLRASLGIVSPWARLTSSSTASYGTNRVDHEFLFKAPTAAAAASFFIEINQNSGTTYIDNIAFFEVTSTGEIIGTNLYNNSGQFENGISGISVWSSNNNQSAVWDSNSKISNIYYYPVKDATGSTTTATAIVTQPATPFIATATAPPVTVLGGTTTILVSATGGTPPYSGTGSFGPARGLYTYNYIVTDAKGCTANTSITISQNIGARFATTNGGLSINADSIANRSLSSSAINETNKLTINSYPNPTTTEFTLLVKGGTNESVNISLFSIEGMVVFKTQGPSNKQYRFGNDLPAGMYIIQVIQGNSHQTLKIIKAK